MTIDTYPLELEPIFKNLPKLTVVDQDFIVKAYTTAREAHGNQLRKSGEPYMVHPVAVAIILSELRLDTRAVAAALLHDVIEDTGISLEDLEAMFGEEVAQLVDGVTKMDQLPTEPEQPAKGSGYKPASRDAETLRKLFLTMGDDMRVVLIKLADRLHNMRTLGFLPKDRQQRMARETMDIFAPLANRLGIWQMKWELEDLSFRYLMPDRYREIDTQLNERRADRERFLERIKARLYKALDAEGINAQISARPKHIYSIYRKMERKSVSFDAIFDIHAVRVIVPDKATCYNVLGVVHSLWRPIPSEFDDYIAVPKDNFYRSLHTAVFDDVEGKTIEVQIRTAEMHEQAEYGIAAHWRYKEGSKYDRDFDERLNYLRRLMDFEDSIEKNAQEFVEAMRSDVFESRVMVFTPKGDVVDLPAGATPIDFAYHIHTEIGHRCRGAKVNDRLVGLDYRLRSGDRIEILTAKRGGPSLDWLNPSLGYVRTTRAMDKIRIYFRKQDRDKNITFGGDVVDRELKRLGVGAMPRDMLAGLFGHQKVEDFMWHVGLGDITGAQIATKVLEAERERHIREGKAILDTEINRLGEHIAKETVANQFGYSKVDDFFALVGSGEITTAQIKAKVLDIEGKKSEQPKPHKQTGRLGGAAHLVPVSAGEGIDILGGAKGAMAINLARCCNPAQGDSIVGYITRNRGITVHRADCSNVINSTEPDRLINVTWGRATEQRYRVPVLIIAYDREGLMRDIGAAVANESINMTDVNIVTRSGVATFNVIMEIEEVSKLTKVLSRIEQLPNVVEARRKT